MHDNFQSIRNFLKKDLERTKKCLQCIDFLIRRRVNVDVALNERRFYYIY
jgi:predicted adenine nucleotide alpha hydrolase (AANH) superfamily ATPase